MSDAPPATAGTITLSSMPSLVAAELMVVAMQLKFEARPLGFPRRTSRDGLVALLLRFDGETLRTIREARVESVEISHSATVPGHV